MKLSALLLTFVIAAFVFAAGAQAAAPSAQLTAADAQKICQFRAKGDNQKYSKCIQRHQKAIGKDIGKNDAKTLAKISKTPTPGKPPADAGK